MKGLTKNTRRSWEPGQSEGLGLAFLLENMHSSELNEILDSKLLAPLETEPPDQQDKAQ